jgi:hypothetical protein
MQLILFKATFSRFYEWPYWPHIILISNLLVYYFGFPVVFNFIDGVVFGTSAINSLFPHYPLLYPLSTQAMMFFTGSFCEATLWMRAIHFVLLMVALLYTVEAFENKTQKLLFAVGMMLYTPVFVFQLGPGTEAFFLSFLILYIGSFIRLYFRYSRWHFAVHLIAFTGLIMSRHTGVLLASIPLLFVVSCMIFNKQHPLRERSLRYLIAILLVFGSVTAINHLASFVLNAPSPPLYGRPAMHIIKNIFHKIPEEAGREQLYQQWRQKATSPLHLKAQECIYLTDHPWLYPKNCLDQFVEEEYPFMSRQKKRSLSDKILNEVYMQFLSTRNKYIWKEMAVSLLKFVPIQSNASDMIPNHIMLYQSGVNSTYNFWNCRFDDFFPLNTKKIKLLYIPSAIERIFSLLLMLWVCYSLIRRRTKLPHKHFSFAIMAGAILHILSMWLFTEFLPRYNIATFVLLLFVSIFWADAFLNSRENKSAVKNP